MADSSPPTPILSAEEIDAWCEKYGSTPFVRLALECSANGDPGPMRVMVALRDAVAVLTEERDEAQRQAEYWHRKYHDLPGAARVAVVGARSEPAEDLRRASAPACPECGSTDRAERVYDVSDYLARCEDAWHGGEIPE